MDYDPDKMIELMLQSGKRGFGTRDSDQVSYTGDRPFGLRQLVDFLHIRQKACDTLCLLGSLRLSGWMIYDV